MINKKKAAILVAALVVLAVAAMIILFKGQAAGQGQQAELEKAKKILVDSERTLSKSLGLFQTEWNGSKFDQNIPSVYIIDANGVLQFKYLGQNTVDRSGYDYLFKVLEVINAAK